MIIIAVVLLVITTVYILIRRNKKKAETPCGCGCSSSGCTECDSEKTAQVIKTLVLTIEGMHCVRCQSGVSEALNSLDGVSATVDLENNCAKVDLSKDVPEDELKQAISGRGFAVTAVKTE